MADNPFNKLKMPAAKKGVASQSKPADPLGLDMAMDEEDDLLAEDDEVDDLFGDEGESTMEYDPEMSLGDASLEEVRAALKAKEKEEEKLAAEEDYSEELDSEDEDL
jgi:hypothetical protein